MEKLLEFFSFSDPSIVAVTLGCVLLTSSSAIVGTFTFLKKKALTGDAVAHSVLPGVCLAFLLGGTKDPVTLIIGAFISGWISLVVMDEIIARSKLKEDSAIAIVLSVFFGLGILLLTFIQHRGNAAQTGLESFLFGSAASLVGRDLWVFGIVSLVLILLVSLFYKELKLLAFDEPFAKSIGLPVRALNILLTTLTVLAVVTGIQAVGVVLMAAMLITPPAAARFWTHNVFKLTLIAAIMGGLSGLAGAFVSYTAPTMPTGPWIVVVISGMAIVSFLFAPQRGIISRWRQKQHMIQNLMDENLLKEFYHLEEQNNFAVSQSYSLEDILSERFFPKNQLYRSLRRLKHKDYLLQIEDQWSPTSEGRQKGKRLVKLHRLWELYLSNEMNIAPDHVHDDAETIEHVITPEIEAELEHLLSYPEKDPHNKEIPYS